MGEPQTQHLYDFGIFGRVQTLPNQYYFSLETPGHLKKIKQIHGIFQKYYCCKSQPFWKSKMLTIRRTKHNDDPSNQILKILDVGAISIKKT